MKEPLYFFSQGSLATLVRYNNNKNVLVGKVARQKSVEFKAPQEPLFFSAKSRFDT